ncbi:tripartite tricarboxylate transporter substrate binding protein [Lampropedia puyangensis]|uniref:Tripartite tricarboxylate transporter substrate binding protein n=2 Tax=Lampropedia puyangensis TaxID=1330072 RepID=A0A4S8FE56_9BURK|nr:tripartite tricarboxylate transporter substrate binding protein [Lampropedia puyangensis]
MANTTSAQNFPDKTVKIIVPYAPGGATDIIARILSDELYRSWNTPVIVENRAGAGTTVGAEFVAKSPPNGYTLYETTATHTVTSSLYSNLSFDPVKDFTPITLTSTIPLVLVVANKVPANDLPSFLNWAKALPQGLSIGSPGTGSVQHLTSELFKQKTGIKGTNVPYRGGAPMVTDLVGNQLDAAFVTLSEVAPYISSGKVKAIALAHHQRMKSMPEIPTFDELGMKDFLAATWFGTFAPANMDPTLRDKIAADIQSVVALPGVTRKLEEMGGEVNNLGPIAFKALVEAEQKRWAEAVALSGAKID